MMKRPFRLGCFGVSLGTFAYKVDFGLPLTHSHFSVLVQILSRLTQLFWVQIGTNFVNRYRLTMTTENLGGGRGEGKRPLTYTAALGTAGVRSAQVARVLTLPNALRKQRKAKQSTTYIFSIEDALYSRETQFRFQRSHAMHLVEEAPPLRIHTCLTYMLLLLLRMMGGLS